MRSLILALALLLPAAAFGIEIPDPNLEAVLRGRLGVHDREITPADMEDLVELRAFERDIEDLTGLEHAVNLEEAILECNDITDISPLAQLTKLRELCLGDNEVVDISPLANLTALEDLQVGGNEIVEIDALANLTALKFLNIGYNDIEDISPLANHTAFERLSMSGNPITEFSPITGIAIREMDLRSLHIKHLDFLSPITALETLTLTSNRIEDLSPLESLTALTSLALGENRISRIGTLARLPNLEYVSLYGNRVSDASALAAHPSLERVTLSENRLTSLEPLATISGIKSINVSNNAIDSIDALSGVETLEWIYFDRNFIDLSPGSDAGAVVVELEQSGTRVYADPQYPVLPVLIPDSHLESKLRAELNYSGPLTTRVMALLQTLDTDEENVVDLTGLEHAIYLEELRVEEGGITDLSPLAQLRRLRLLDARENLIENIEPLRRLHRLEVLDLSENLIVRTDLALEVLWRLESVSVGDNPLTQLRLPNPFRLTHLDASDCQLTDISDLARARLLEELVVSSNPNLADISPLAGLQNLRFLNAGRTSLGSPGALAPLSGLPALENLSLIESGISDISHLVDLPALATLSLQQNAITDVTPLAALPALRELGLDDNQVADFTSLAGLASLEFLSLARNRIPYIPDLSGLSGLGNINLRDNAITDIGPLLTLGVDEINVWLEGNYIDTESPESIAVRDATSVRGYSVFLDNQRTPPVAPMPALAIGLDPDAPATLTISFTGEPGVSYQLRFSDDLAGSQAIGTPVMGDGSPVEFALPMPAAPDGFFTVVATVVQ